MSYKKLDVWWKLKLKDGSTKTFHDIAEIYSARKNYDNFLKFFRKEINQYDYESIDLYCFNVGKGDIKNPIEVIQFVNDVIGGTSQYSDELKQYAKNQSEKFGLPTFKIYWEKDFY